MWCPHVTVAALLKRQDRFLMVEEVIDSKVFFNQPAGHLEDRETLSEAVVRETREETGWLITPQALVGIYQWRHPQSANTYLRFAFQVEAVSHDNDAVLDPEIQAVHWLTIDEIKARQAQLRSPLVWQCVQDYCAGIRYPMAAIQHMAEAFDRQIG